MISEIKRYGDYVKKLLLRRNKLNFLILYATSKCNLSCQTCFFHNQLNNQSDLSLADYEKIANSAGKFSILAIGGGEPFLRHDLEKICAIFIKRCRLDTLFIPTNGTLTEIILTKTENLLKQFPQVSISINPSLDGLAEYHDKNRALAGTFAVCVSTIERLVELKKKYSNLQVIVNSVVNRDNLDELKMLMEFLKRFAIDFQAFELLRGDYKDKTLALPPLEKIKELHELILENRYYYLKRRPLNNKLLSWLEEVLVLGVLRYGQFFKELALSGRKWPSACPAGKNISVIYPGGQYSPCELLPAVINLKDFDYEFKKACQSRQYKNAIENINKMNCDCTHICFIHSAIAAAPKSIIKITQFYLQARKILAYDQHNNPHL